MEKLKFLVAIFFVLCEAHAQQNTQYLIITTEEFSESASIMTDIHQNQINPARRLNTEIVYLDSILTNYPGWEFQDAIREFILSQINENSDLHFLLIIGDETVIPPYYDMYVIPSDDFFSSIQTSYPQAQLATGRIPVADPEIAVQITEKISDYILQPPAGHWKSSMLLVADDTHKAGGGDILVEISHVSHSNDIYEMMRDATEIQCLYGTDYDLFYGGGIPTLPELTADVLSAINEGVAWINYIGHGNETTLADELILDMERDLSFISPPLGKIPVWVVGSCDLGHYDNADCLTEALIAKPDGAIAMITTTRLILSQPVGAYLERLYTNLHEFSQIPSDFRLGDLVMESKSGSSDYVFQLFGDPALPIVLPQYSVITTEYPDTLRILDQNTITTVDSLIGFSSHITVRGPDQFIHQVYEGWVNLNYQLPGIRIFSGDFSDSVPLFIPMDYPLCETCPAEILLSSDNSQEAGQTYFQSIPGVPVIPPNSVDDSSPPEIQLTYFGSEVLEDQIVEIPYTFVLTLQDSSGLNLMDLPGHQIQYQIDNQYPIDITGQFQYTQDNFGHGFVEFEIGPEFSGNHDLVLEAWDNANNRSVLNRSLCFEDCGNEEPIVDYGWSSITSVLTANDLTQSGGSLYASTSGGLLEFSMDSHDFQKILPGEALVHGNLISIYRDSHHYLWIGSANPGALQIYEPNVGLLRNIDNLNITSISKFYPYENSTFAIGEINSEPSIIEFRDGEEQLPFFQASYNNFPEEISFITHISFHGDSIFVCTSSGVYWALISEGMLGFSTSWTSNLSGWQPIYYFPGDMPIMVTNSSLIRRIGTEWETVYSGFIGSMINAGFSESGDFFVLTSNRFYRFDNMLTLIEGYPISSADEQTFTSSFSGTDRDYLGVAKQGIMVVSLLDQLTEFYIPNTIFSDEMNALTFTNTGGLAAVSRKGLTLTENGISTNFIASNQISGYVLNQLESDNFTGIPSNYAPGSNLPWSIHETQSGSLVFSNSGIAPSQPGFKGGVIEIDPVSFEVAVYDTTDGILDGLNGIYNPFWTNRYLTINQIKMDPSGNLWVVNPYSEVYNHIAAIKLVDGSGWVHVTGPDDISYLPQEVAFDGFGRAWFAIQYDIPMNNNISEYSTGGLRVLDYNQTIDDESDDQWISITNQDILPSNSVWSIDIDQQNHVWIVTSTGIQSYQMLNTVNGIELTELLDWPAYSQIPFHIGDHIRVDDRGTKWITTKHHGFFAIFSDGSLLNNGLGFQSSNSGLLSDLVYDVAIDEINQFASFATLNGISILDVSGFPDSQFLPTGDVNGDGQSDVTDVVAVIFFILGLSDPGTINQFEADMNQDDIVDIVDVVAIVNQILNPSLICQTPPSYIRIQGNKFECELISDTEVIAYHLFFESHNEHYIEVLSDGWEVFFNESELIAIFIPNTESGKYVNLKLKINDIVFTGGRGCNRLGNCVDLQTPIRWTIHSPYPNPFNPVVSLRYDIPETGDLRVSVYDLNGRLVDTIFEDIRNPGEYTLRWNAAQFASGVYFVKFKYQDDVRTEKILLLK